MLQTSYRSQVFLGVHFVLFGFDPITENKVRFKLVNGGGVDVGQYSRSCTHVIVDKLEYDDPVCVAAQNDGKTLVTALWVDHSADIGMPVDASSVMYRPLKNLNGIPGADSLIVCLTGYQRQDRDDIMTMVGLMGAQFSKPLVANKVTHLICYKFEGEKYELAKKLPTIKLVNHRWLEDCLKEWVLLPEDKYSKSGCELEMMEAEAKDSEDEADGSMLGQYGGRTINRSPTGSKIGLAMTRELSNSVIEASNACTDSTAPEGLGKGNKGEDLSLVSGNGCRSDQVCRFNSVNNLEMTSKIPDVVRKDALVQLPETYVKTPEGSNNDITNAFGHQDLGAPADTNPPGSGLLPDMHHDVRSTSESDKIAAHSDAKASADSYSRKNTRGFSLPKNLNESSGNGTGPSVSRVDDLKFSSNPETASCKMERAKGSISSPCVKASGKGCDFNNGEESISLLPQKRIIEASCTPLKSRKVTSNAKSSVDRTPPANDKVQGMKLASLINETPENEDHFSVRKDWVNNSNTSSVSKSAAFTSNSLPFNVPISKSVGSESVQGDNAHQKSAKASVKSSSMSKTNGKPEITSSSIGEAAHVGNATQPQKVQEDLGNSAPNNKRSQNEESAGLGNLNLCNEVSNDLLRKSPRKKTIAKKSLGARPKLNAAAKQKVSVSSERATPKVDGVNCSSSCQDPTTCDAEKLQTSPQIADDETSLEQENVNKFAENASNRTEFLDDETEAPEDELGIAIDENKSELVDLSKKADSKTEEMSEAINQLTNCEEETLPKKGRNQSKQQKVVSRTKPELDLSSKAKENHKRKKCPAGRNKIKTTVAMDIEERKIHSERKDDAEVATPEQVSLPAGRNDGSTLLTNNLDSFSGEKENIPIDGQQDVREGGSGGNSGIKSSVGSAKINQRVSKTSDCSSVPKNNKRTTSEAVCFIVSGHRLQRKEFQQVIRRLKGRVCRDSHQWSYQATHFIAPDPIRRTEKFFAAAASGRWILKTDYLTACSQAGKFLAEEPYEWHKSGLSEDGAISMEAPRKWRLLKERTGHGALHGVRVIIYGDCIAPSLDTLKRVIRAGDGTLLATSPPYTRFLDEGIDYAIVGPGMPRVDAWVQEFLKHEIPCVVSDYLVEYVCKPGFSLERHVLYGTQAWAEKSFARLQSMAEEITEELAPSERSDDNDIMCQVCGSKDRGEVMLICGDESGSVGCGIGSHIDCCDPSLDSVPEEDWFCPKCRSRNCSNPPKKKKNRLSSSSKRK